jgi:hypothetical protein
MEVNKEVETQAVDSVWNEAEQQAIHADAGSAFAGAPAPAAAPVPSGEGSAAMEEQSEHGGAQLKAVETIRKTEKTAGPNDPCPCGSGKKFKKCCMYGGGPDTPGTIRTGGKEHKGEVRLGG